MSRHHWMYFGCQCSSARCSRLLLESPTLLGMRSAEIMSRPVEVEFRPRLRAVRRQRPFFADGIGPDENPVLPGGEATEDFRLHRLRSGEAEVCLHTGERVGR